MNELIIADPQKEQYAVNFFKNISFERQAKTNGFKWLQLPSGENTVIFEMDEFLKILRHGNQGLYNEAVHPLKQEGDIFVRETDENMREWAKEMVRSANEGPFVP